MVMVWWSIYLTKFNINIFVQVTSTFSTLQKERNLFVDGNDFLTNNITPLPVMVVRE